MSNLKKVCEMSLNKLEKTEVFEKIDNLIRYELENEPAYESFEDVIADYISSYCFYSSEDFIRNIIDQLENILEADETE